MITTRRPTFAFHLAPLPLTTYLKRMADRPSDPIHDNDRTALAAFVLTVVLIAVGSLWPQSG